MAFEDDFRSVLDEVPVNLCRFNWSSNLYVFILGVSSLTFGVISDKKSFC